jgi:uncharacterized membrane protein YcaP (DUF421 family)
MKKEDIKFDAKRILVGDAPGEFLLEVFIRTSVTYIALLIILRLLGKRMSGQLTITEFAVMLTLGAIIAPPMQDPAKGILAGLIILVCAVIFQRGLTWWYFKDERVEELALGKVSTLVKDGVIVLAEMNKSDISKQQLFAKLRGAEIYNLADVERVYLEACGEFSIFKSHKGLPGLELYPTGDGDIKSGNVYSNECIACANCGYTTIQNTVRCVVCNADNWTKAIQ